MKIEKELGLDYAGLDQTGEEEKIPEFFQGLTGKKEVQKITISNSE